MNTKRRKFLKTAVLGGMFVLLIRTLNPLSSLSRKYLTRDKDIFSGLERKENNKEIIFSDKNGNRVLVVEK